MHHDGHAQLEKSGLFSFIQKTYGKAEYGAQECFIGVTDWGHGIICSNLKTFFPASWSKEKVVDTIFQAHKNRIEELEAPSKNQQKFLCQGPGRMLIDIIIDHKNMIISAYPSVDNFIGI